MSILIGLFTFVLILVSLFLGLVILAQKSKNDGGMGAALGGGMAEATFGADTGDVLSKSTIYATIAFFVLTFGLYLAQLHASKSDAGHRALPTITVPPEEAPAVSTETVEAPAADIQIEVPAAAETPAGDEQPAQP